jgi:predicted NBD/HSP70 family sugar kinase
MGHGPESRFEMKVGIDVGGTTMCVIAATGDPLNPERILGSRKLGTTGQFEDDMFSLSRCLRTLEFDFGPITHLGMAVAGRLSADRKMVLGAGNLTDWIDKPMAARVRSMCPDDAICSFGNDAEAQALMEALTNPEVYGVDFLYVAIGTGIGMARIIWRGGKPYSLPMEGGHLPATGRIGVRNPELCGCKQFNCTERLASGSGAEQRFGVRSAKDLTEVQWDDVAYHQARGIASALTCHPVQTVVYGGGIPERQPHLMGRVQDHLNRVAIGAMSATLVASLGTKAGAGLSGLVLLTQA